MPGAGVPLEVAIRRKVFAAADGGRVEAVRDLAFAVRPGETVCLIGPSGAGKTTTLRILLGLDGDYEGRVEPGPDRMRVGMVFQEPRLLPWRTVEANVRLALPRRDRERPLDALFADVGLEPWRGRYPGELSLGVALARALAGDPDLLVLDEPFVSLDDRAAAALRAVVFALAQARGLGVLMVTHNVAEALGLADRLVLVTPRPARLIADVPLRQPRPERTGAWIQATRADLARLYPEAVAA